jgi:hypothetical protein
LAPLAELYAADTPSAGKSAFVYSPGNWTGDAGRAGKIFRQTWNPGAYFRVTWESKNPQPVAKLRLDISTHQPGFKTSPLAYCIDGIWKSNIPLVGEIVIEGITGAGHHELAVYLQQTSTAVERWGSEGKSGLNVLRIIGLSVDAASRWNKIDGNNHSLLDSMGHISAYGQTDQEPSLIMINYGTNDILHKSNPSDVAASITKWLWFVPIAIK